MRALLLEEGLNESFTQNRHSVFDNIAFDVTKKASLSSESFN